MEFHDERVFDLRMLGPPLGVQSRGLLLGYSGSASTTSWLASRYGQATVAGEHQCIFRVPLRHGSLAVAGLATIRCGHVAGVAMHEGGNTDLAQLALAFAIHLNTRRREDPDPVRPCLTSAGKPDLASVPDLVRVPHLVTLVAETPGGLSDHVLWEVMTRSQASRWLGGPIPNQALFEQGLPSLLQLRQLIRTGRVPGGHLGQCLREVLAERYMSIRVVYQHSELFAELIRVICLPPASGGENV